MDPTTVSWGRWRHEGHLSVKSFDGGALPIVYHEKTERQWGCSYEVFRVKKMDSVHALGIMFTVHCMRWRDVSQSKCSRYACTLLFLATSLNYSAWQPYSKIAGNPLYMIENVIHGKQRGAVGVCVRFVIVICSTEDGTAWLSLANNVCKICSCTRWQKTRLNKYTYTMSNMKKSIYNMSVFCVLSHGGHVRIVHLCSCT